MEHSLIPPHEKVSEDEKKILLEKYNITLLQLPKIKIDDPSIKHLSLKRGDVVKIIRKSVTAGNSTFYRVVVNA